MSHIKEFLRSILISVVIFFVVVVGLFAAMASMGTETTASAYSSSSGESSVSDSTDSTDNGNTEAAEGDGYTKTYSYKGKTYRLYEQWMGSYESIPYGGGTIHNYGCGPTCVAIICSGYGINKNPGNIVKESTSTNSDMTLEAIGDNLNQYGLKYTLTGSGGYVFTDTDKANIISHLKGGDPVILLIHRPIVLINGGTSGTTDHYVTILGINDKNQLYIGDPGNQNTDGWATMDSLCNNSLATNYFLVSK